MNKSAVTDGLKNSPKGRLEYHPYWLETEKKKDILMFLTSPPELKNQASLYLHGETGNDRSQFSQAYGNRKTDQANLLNDVNMKGDDDQTKKTYTGRAAASAGLNNSDFDKQLIALHNVKQMEDADMRDMALRTSESYEKRFQQFSQSVTKRTEGYWHDLCKKKDKEIEMFAQQKEKELKKRFEDNMKDSELKIKEYQIEDTKLKKSVLDAVKKQEETDRIREMQNKEQIAKLQQALQEIMKHKVNFCENIKQFDNSEPFSESVLEQLETITNLSQQIEGMLSAVQSRPAVSWDVRQLTNCVSRAQDIVETVRVHVASEEKRYKEKQQVVEQQKRSQQQQEQTYGIPPENHQQSGSQPGSQQHQQQQETNKTGNQIAQNSALSQQQPKQQSVSQAVNQQPQVPQTNEQQENNSEESNSESRHRTANEGDKIMLNSVFRDSYKHYLKLINFQKERAKLFQCLVSDPKMKKSKFDLQKTVNTLVNTISSGSGRQLREKLCQIRGLLSGSTVTIGSKSVCAKSCAGGLEFCRDLFAKKLVSQGETQVASQPESAFVFAAVAVGVWSEIPEVGDLILAHFYLVCPYLVPYYVPKQEDQSSEEYYKLLGYTYEDGQCEKQDQFLKRMSGLMHFYAAITVSAPPDIKPQHPFGVDKAWSWLTQVIHLDPRPDITATLIYEFLEVTAYFLMQAYKKQFNKLLCVIIREYLPKVRMARDGCSGGPVVRLEGYLEKLRTGNATRPNGYPDQYFWLS